MLDIKNIANYEKEYYFQRFFFLISLILINKAKGDLEKPSAYRPLCMLDNSGKLLERLLKPRLSAAIENGGGYLLGNMVFYPFVLQLTS